MAFLRLRHPKLTQGFSNIADPNELNDNFDDIARVVNGNLGAENLHPSTRLPASKSICNRSSVVLHFDLNIPASGTPVNRYLYKAAHAMKLVAVGVCGATTSFSDEWYVRNGPIIMADIRNNHAGTNVNYLVDAIEDAAVSAGDTIGIYTVGDGTITGVTLMLTAEHV